MFFMKCDIFFSPSTKIYLTYMDEEYSVGRGEIEDLLILLTKAAISCFITIHKQLILE